jgi:hypothetical protein
MGFTTRRDEDCNRIYPQNNGVQRNYREFHSGIRLAEKGLPEVDSIIDSSIN